MDMRLEVIAIPVSDVEAAKTFYVDRVGFALDHDVEPGKERSQAEGDTSAAGSGMRVVQLTPPGSPTSVVFGSGMPLGEPGATKGLHLVVEDIDAVREELAGRGVGISEVQQLGPEGQPGSRFAFFADPDGNGWSLQEIKRA